MHNNPNGAVLWRTHKIQAIVTGLASPSRNPKTGPMHQLWILRRDRSPVQAVRDGTDRAICGQCPHRGANGTGRTCYVNVGNAPSKVWESSNLYNGALPERSTASIRLGAYGDPTFVPLSTLQDLVSRYRGHTGYTHQWRDCAPEYRQLLMASVETLQGKTEANAAGWRTFRVLPIAHKGKSTADLRAAGALLPDEVLCPATKEGGLKATCATCRLCSGTSLKAHNVAIVAHGDAVKARHLAKQGNL